MNVFRTGALALLAFCLPGGERPVAAEMEILPPRITLSSTAARQRLIVQDVVEGRYQGQVTEQLELVSSDPAVAIASGRGGEP